MMQGDLIEMLEKDEIDILIHQTNCHQTLGEGRASGIAGALGKQYPELLEYDLTYNKGDINQLGEYAICPVTTKSGKTKYVVNCYSQYMYGPVYGTSPTSYMAMQYALHNINTALLTILPTHPRAGTYMLGCSLGGAKWSVVEQILTNCLTNLDELLIVIKD